MEGLFEDSKSFLMKNNEDGVSLYDHLSDLMLKVIEERPEDGVDAFEVLSREVKMTSGKVEPTQNAANATAKVVQPAQDLDKLKSTIQMFKSQQTKTYNDDEDEEYAESEISEEDYNEGEMSNICAEASVFEQGGFGLTQQEAFRVSLAVKNLVRKNPIASAKFFGKIFGTKADYFVVQATMKGDDDYEEAEEEDEDSLKLEAEDSGNGANKYAYFVTTNLSEPFSRLPNVKPEWIVAARQITKLLSGDLEAEIRSYPPFPGNEGCYLRAQIARISASTAIAPAGAFMGEDDEEYSQTSSTVLTHVDLDVEFEGMEQEKLMELDNWQHYESYILPQGRTTYMVPPQPAKEEESDAESVAESEIQSEMGPEPEEGPELLASVADDADIDEETPMWTVKTSGKVGFTENNPVYVRSNLWPGSVSFAMDRTFATWYIGNGQKYTGVQYFPPMPPVIQSEVEELVEMDDPTVEEEEALKQQLAEEEPPSESDSDSDGDSYYED